ncbi:MAG: DUF2293 domain-containing protein, partial [Calditrichaeota bacterium]|nr:DUF2293 domain-containing protein [Calditrichota bacterium]
MEKRSKDKTEIVVFICLGDFTCFECEENLGRGAFITLDKNKNALCLSCSDLHHLVFLPSGNTALTRRSKKHSTLYAVVLKWSRSRKRYERQGILVEEEALEKAERECLADAEIRERIREREALRRQLFEEKYVDEFSRKIRELFPHAPKGVEKKIAGHACQKYSGRVGRSAEAKQYSPEAINLAVRAYIRHNETNYDELLI